MTEDEFKRRTKRLAIDLLKIVETLPKSIGSSVIARQLARSGTSIGANYRAACRARSRAEMAAKLGIVEEEADETIYWLEIAVEAGYVKEEHVKASRDEAEEILRMTIASRRRLREPIENRQSQIKNRP